MNLVQQANRSCWPGQSPVICSTQIIIGVLPGKSSGIKEVPYGNLVSAPAGGIATGLQVGLLPVLSAAAHGSVDLPEASEVLSLHGEGLA